MARRRKLLKDETKKFKEFQDTTRRIAKPDRKVTQQDDDVLRKSRLEAQKREREKRDRAEIQKQKENTLKTKPATHNIVQTGPGEPTAPVKRPGAVKAAKPAKTATKVPTRLRGVVKAAKPASGRNKAILITNKKDENK